MKISPIQVIASALAAVVAAVLLSFLGAAGTIVGVALGSIIATVGGAAIAESMRRTHSAVRHVVDQRFPATSGTSGPGGTSATGSGATRGRPHGRSGISAAAEPGVRPLASSSGVLRQVPPSAGGAPGETGATPGGVTPESRGAPGETGGTEPVGGVAELTRPVGTGAAGGQPGGGKTAGPGARAPGRGAAAHARQPGRGGPRGSGPRLVFGLRWPVLLGAIALVFAITVAVVLIIQAVSGQPLSDTVRGRPAPMSTTVPATTTVPSTVPQRTTTTLPPRTTTTTVPQTTTTSAPPQTTTTSVSGGASTTVPTGGPGPAAGPGG